MDLGLSGTGALVAAASSGLGYASARALAREGAQVALFSRRAAAAEAAAKRIAEETGARTLGFAADVTAPGELEAAVERAATTWGQLDVLVTNAGGPPPGLFRELDDQAWQRAFDLTLLSAVRLTRAALPHLERSPRGRIIFLTSSAVKQPVTGLVLSNAVRIGISGLVKSLADELGPRGITVNQVLPGRIATERIRELDRDAARRGGASEDAVRQQHERAIPLGRYGNPDELAAAVAFLASTQAAYITGASLQVDGGLIRSVL
jgi:3-oxoacyl-[acyl-carrier protein] reductase